jgi:hypothetical protein
MVEADFSTIHKIKWYQEKQEVDVQTAFDESVRLYREQLLPVIQEAGISVGGQKVRLVGAGIGGVIDALAVMQVTGALDVEVIDVGEDVFKPAMSLKGLIAHQYPQFENQLEHIALATADITKMQASEQVPVSIIRSIPPRYGKEILKGMTQTTRSNGVVVATIYNNSMGEAAITIERQMIRDAFTSLANDGKIRVFKDTSLTKPIRGGGLFRGDAHVFAAKVTGKSR